VGIVPGGLGPPPRAAVPVLPDVGVQHCGPPQTVGRPVVRWVAGRRLADRATTDPPPPRLEQGPAPQADAARQLRPPSRPGGGGAGTRATGGRGRRPPEGGTPS